VRAPESGEAAAAPSPGDGAGRSPELAGLAGLVAALAASQILAAAFNLVRAKGVAVYLGPAGMGIVSLVDQLAYVVAFTAAFALPAAGVKYLSKAHSQGGDAFGRAYRLFVQTLLFTSTCVAVVMCAVTLAWPEIWGPLLAPRAGLLVLALLTVPAMGLHGLQLNVFAALRHPGLASLGRLGSTALMALGALAGLLVAGLTGLYAGNLLAAVVAAAVMLGYTRRRFGLRLSWGVWPAWSEWRLHRDVLRFCAVTYLISVGEPLAFLLARYALLQSADLAELGLFQSAYAVASYMGLLFVQSTAFYLTPLMNRVAPAAEKMVRALEFQRQMALGVTAVALPLVLFPRLVLSLLFSDAFVAAAPYLALFVLGQAVFLLAGVLQALLIGLDDLRTHLVASIGTQATLASLCWLLAPAFGLWGVALAFLVAYAGLFLVCLARLMVRHGTRLPARSAVAIPCGLLLVLAAGWLGQGATEDGQAIATRLLVATAGAAGLALFLTRDERSAVHLAWSRVWRPRGA
jgi:O-antigen/teichoic acid export membrane protein